jgi:pectate lyase
VSSALRYQVIRLRLAGTSNCITLMGSAVSLSACGGSGQELRLQVLSLQYLSIQSNATGQCLGVSSTTLAAQDCTNGPAQQFAYTGSAAAGYKLVSFSQNQSLTPTLALGASAASFEVLVVGAADRLAVAVDERAVGSATLSADVIVPDGAPANGDEATRAANGTTGGGAWETAKSNGFSNVYWFKPADFASASREAAAAALSTALSGTAARIVLFEAGEYDFSLATPASVDSCSGTCANGATYKEVGGFCNCSSTTCTTGGYKDATRTLDIGSNKSIIGLGSGAIFKHLMMRVVRNGNLILRNLAYRQLPGDVRAWDDALLFYPGDHVWLDHISFSGFGRGSVVLSGTRVTSGSSFYTYRDSGWMTFSWLAIDASEPWRCSGSEDSPYPFFTTNDPALTFEHVLFQHGGGRNPAIDGEGAHFFNCAWVNVKDGLDGRGSAKLLVEGSYFDGKLPIRMDDPLPPTVLAPWDGTLLTDKRRQNIFSSSAWASLVSDWGGRKLDTKTLNTNTVSAPAYPYGLDADPNATQATVTANAGVGKANFPSCTLPNTNKAAYTCQ